MTKEKLQELKDKVFKCLKNNNIEYKTVEWVSEEYQDMTDDLYGSFDQSKKDAIEEIMLHSLDFEEFKIITWVCSDGSDKVFSEGYWFYFENFFLNQEWCNRKNMKNYYGAKQIKARPMSRLDYCTYRGWDFPEDENGADEGYLVEYLDSKNSNHELHECYISWSPKEQFENAYRETEGLTFGLAVEALKQGKRVARKGWNGKGMFIFMQVPSKISIDIVPKMTSLPQSVKDEFIRRNKETTDKSKSDAPHDHSTIDYKNQIAMVYPDNSIYGWVASPSDCLEEDWMILD